MKDHLPPWIIAIGASGSEGLTDLRDLLSEWHDLDATVLIVLHRPWDTISQLRRVLGRSSHMPVCIADQDQHLRAGHVYIGEPAAHLTLAAREFGHLIADPGRAYRNRTVDLLFHSVAAISGRRTVGVVLSGSFDDGSRGLAAIQDAGGSTMIVSRIAESWPGMPENARAYDGPIDVIGDVPAIARAIEKAVAKESTPS